MMSALVVSSYARNERMSGVFVRHSRDAWEKRWSPDTVNGQLWERVSEGGAQS